MPLTHAKGLALVASMLCVAGAVLIMVASIGSGPASAKLMTRSQAIAAVGYARGDLVGARAMSYGQVEAAYPALASSTRIATSRKVWVVTLYFPHPIPNPGSGPIGVTLPPISAATIVIDAASGTETDWCAGCSTIPAS